MLQAIITYIILRMENEPLIDTQLQPTGGEEKPGGSVKFFIVEILQTVILALILYLAIDGVIARVRVENISMEPTLYPGEFLIVNKLAYKLGDLHHGDIIVFHYPLNPEEDYIKRVVGLPGDQVDIFDGEVFVNGNKLDEEYISAAPIYRGSWNIPEDTVFVLGDNRNKSSDSHSWGVVPVSSIVGKALVVYWPLTEIQVLTMPDLLNNQSEL